jgi:hypothetical protein
VIILILRFAAGMERLMLALEEDESWKEVLFQRRKIGIAIIWEKDNQDLNSKLKLKGLQLLKEFKDTEGLTIEPSFHLNKIDKQLQYFDKVQTEN